jgi:hypothetical protein
MALPFLKKKSEVAAGPLTPAWHPNFRNYEKLPDIKVVRTAFFVNAAAITVVLALITYFGSQEWQLRSLKSQIADWQRQIDRDKAGSDRAIALYKKFDAQQAKFAEVDAFLKAKPPVSDLLVRLAQTLPPNIALDSLDLRESGLALRVTVRGTPDAASGYANAYLEQLRADKQFANFDQTGPNGFAITSVQRNTSTGRLNAEFFLSIPKAGKDAKK